MLKIMDFYPWLRNLGKNLSSKCRQKLLDGTKKSGTHALKGTALKRAIQKNRDKALVICHEDEIFKIYFHER